MLCPLWQSGSDNKESTYNARDLGPIPGLGGSPGEGNGYPVQCSGLENYLNRGAWQATVHGSRGVRLDWVSFTSLHHWFGLPWWLRLQRIGLQCRVPGFSPWDGKIPWRRDPTPVFWPGESHGQRSLGGYSPWGCEESDVTEWLMPHVRAAVSYIL